MPSDARGRRRRVAFILAILLLLLLLLCVCSIVSGSVVRTTPANARYIADNRTCLECHVELLGEFQLADVHDPFMRKSCLLCHTDHGKIYMREATPGKLVVLDRCGILVSFEPLRRAVQGCGACGGRGGTLPGACGRTTSLGRRESTVAASAETTLPYNFKHSRLTSPQPTLCFICHRSIALLTSKKYQHNPFKMGKCTATCHRPHASSYPRLLVLPTKQLCSLCHRMTAERALPDQHPPFKNFDCATCHQPHASDYKGILVKQQKALCFSCHPTIARLVSLPVQHSPFMNGDCTGCHKPHSSTPRRLLIESEPALCYRCHPAIRNDFLKPSHHPVGTPLLNCSDCHTPHAGQFKWLLVARDNNLCYTCHGNKQFCYVRSAHNRVVLYGGAPGLCINCHTPHGSVWKPLLIKSEQATCLQCHPTKISRWDLIHAARPKRGSGGFNHNNHPVFDGWRDPLTRTQLTCDSSCHDPHGTCKRAMLRRLPDGLCLSCHVASKLP